jgi:putative spermidine/putrescine transport system permease protein
MAADPTLAIDAVASPPAARRPSRASPVWVGLAAPYAVFLLLLLIVPFVNVALYSIHPYSPTKVLLPELTADNYANIFDLYHLRLFGRTLRLGLITTVVCVLLGYPLAYWLARARPRLQTLGLFLLIMPLMVSTVIRIFGWIVILGRKGLVNQALLALGLDPVKLLYTETAVVIGLVNIFMPFMVLPLMAAIERIPRSLEEAARNLGANWWQTFRHTILPLSLPGLISGCLLVYAESISAFVTPALMGSARERMVGQQIYDEVLVSFNWPSASGLAVTMVLLTLLLMFCALYATRRLGRFEPARPERGG